MEGLTLAPIYITLYVHKRTLDLCNNCEKRNANYNFHFIVEDTKTQRET